MANLLRLEDSVMLREAAELARGAEDSAQTEQYLRAQWARLDAGWQAYSRSSVDIHFSDSMLELAHKRNGLRELSRALEETERMLSRADSKAASLFTRMPNLASSNKLAAPLKPQPGQWPPSNTNHFALPNSSQQQFDAPVGIKLSTSEVPLIHEKCFDNACVMVSASGSYAFKPLDAPATIAFTGDAKFAGIEIELGKYGAIPLGTLYMNTNGGYEYTATSFTQTVHDGSTLKVTISPIAGRKTVPEPYGHRGKAQFTGFKAQLSVIDSKTGATHTASATVRGYVYEDVKGKPTGNSTGKDSKGVPTGPYKPQLPNNGGNNGIGGGGGIGGSGTVPRPIPTPAPVIVLPR